MGTTKGRGSGHTVAEMRMVGLTVGLAVGLTVGESVVKMVGLTVGKTCSYVCGEGSTAQQRETNGRKSSQTQEYRTRGSWSITNWSSGPHHSSAAGLKADRVPGQAAKRNGITSVNPGPGGRRGGGEAHREAAHREVSRTEDLRTF